MKENRLIEKDDVFEQTEVAGIMAGKKTDELIPLCHPLRIEYIDISFEPAKYGVKITSTVSANEKTGVEMEALLACSVAALTVYDMCKMYDKSIICDMQQDNPFRGYFHRAIAPLAS